MTRAWSNVMRGFIEHCDDNDMEHCEEKAMEHSDDMHHGAL